MVIFNQNEWQKKIASPHWYLDIPPLMSQLSKLHDTDRAAYENEKERIYDFFENGLVKGKIALGSTGKDFDLERKPIDTIVIHHTSMKPGLTKERMSAIDLVRLYATEYAKPKYEVDQDIKLASVYSGHFRDGVQVFWPYHWIVRIDGSVERLLLDSEIGWQAGNWDVNCRSIAIVFDNDYENSEPSKVELEAAARLIKERYPHVSKENIIGHCEANLKTTCPSKDFLSRDTHKGWKELLVGML